MSTGEKCTECGAELYAEFVDIGVGMQQVTPGDCPNHCEYIEWEYQQYVKRAEKPLPKNVWLEMHVATQY